MIASSDSEVDVEGLIRGGPSEATPSSTPFPSLRIVPCKLPFDKPIKKTMRLKSVPLSKGHLINKRSPLTNARRKVTSVPLTNGILVNKRLSSPVRTRSVRINNGTLTRKQLMAGMDGDSCTTDRGTDSLSEGTCTYSVDESTEKSGKKRKRDRGTELKGKKNKNRKIMEKENRVIDEDHRDTYVTEEERRETEEERGDMEEEEEQRGDTCMEEERGGDAGEDGEEVCSTVLVQADLLRKFPGRQYQIETLLTMMRKPSDNVIPFVFIHGVQSTGKTSVIKSLLSSLKVRHCYVDMKECYSNRVLFESILNQLTGVTPSRGNKYTGYCRSDSLTSFVTQLKSVLSSDISDSEEGVVMGGAGDAVYIVIDNAEVLKGKDETLLPALIRLPELTRSNVCVIMLSFVVWEKFSFTTGMKTPFNLHFSQYTKDDVIKILSNNLTSSKYSSSFIKNYSNIIWNVVSPVSRDLKDLLYISNIFFPLYCQPVEQGQVSEAASRKLWSHIEPHFKTHISKLILRDRSSEIRISEMLTHKQVTCRSSEVLIQFPVSVKYLLIASYLASHNPLSTDRRFFSKRKQKKRRHENMNRKKREEIKRYLLGPKSHPLDRLMAIYHSITDEDNSSNPNIFSQVETLVNLKFFSRTGGTGSLDSVKYRCLLSFEQISTIAKSIDFEIVRYLHDYNIM